MKRVLPLDETVFDEINEESAYWIGFLMADGNISKNKLALHLQKDDEEHLIKFKQFLGSGHKIIDVPSTKSKRLAVSSKILINKLATYNIIPNKTYVATPPSNLAFNKHFWRGVIDGDGCIGFSNRSTYIRLIGSYNICTGFLNFITYNSIITKAKVLKNGNIYSIMFTNSIANIITKLIYEEAQIYLKRKYLKYKNIQNLIEVKELNRGVLSGVDVFSAKLNKEKVNIIRNLLKEGHKQTTIADMFNISQPTVSQIKRNLSWN